MMVVLLALLAASFTFYVRSSLNGVYARQYDFFARHAAEAGIQRAIVLLRASRGDPVTWYNNTAVFRQAAVEKIRGDAAATFQSYATGAQAAQQPDDKPRRADPMWRFSLYASTDAGTQAGGSSSGGSSSAQQSAVRYGLVPETGKLDLNLVRENQFRRFLIAAVPEKGPNNQTIDRDALVDCFLDWREKGDQPRPKGAKNEYYQTLKPGYRTKGGRFDTVEELLQIKGFSAWVVFGEDFNRNGILDPNEDDGNTSFPPDDADGKLFRGIAPFLTVNSRETNTDSENKPRINLNLRDMEQLEKQLTEKKIDQKLTTYILGIRNQGLAFRSVMDLLPVPPPDPDEEQEDDRGDSTSRPSDESSTSQPTSQASSQPSRRGSGRQTSQPSQGGRSTSRPSRNRPLTNLTDEVPPGTVADLPVILDRLTTAAVPLMVGRINVDTAGREVLLSINDFTEEEVDAIVSNRTSLSGDEMRTPAWLLTRGLISERKFRQNLNRLTCSSQVFSMDSVGYADHVGTMRRLNVMIEMRGPIGQVLYYRDLTSLGPAYTPGGEETRGIARESAR
ncbi:MAG: type II secretion system protein GspK [Phycisphaerae bacterium]